VGESGTADSLTPSDRACDRSRPPRPPPPVHRHGPHSAANGAGARAIVFPLSARSRLPVARSAITAPSRIVITKNWSEERKNSAARSHLGCHETASRRDRPSAISGSLDSAERAAVQRLPSVTAVTFLAPPCTHTRGHKRASASGCFRSAHLASPRTHSAPKRD
jgi:hypothetical protein